MGLHGRLSSQDNICMIPVAASLFDVAQTVDPQTAATLMRSLGTSKARLLVSKETLLQCFRLLGVRSSDIPFPKCLCRRLPLPHVRTRCRDFSRFCVPI